MVVFRVFATGKLLELYTLQLWSDKERALFLGRWSPEILFRARATCARELRYAELKHARGESAVSGAGAQVGSLFRSLQGLCDFAPNGKVK